MLGADNPGDGKCLGLEFLEQNNTPEQNRLYRQMINWV